MLKILFFCQLYPPAIFGGGEYIFFQWAKELVKRGHKIIVITQCLEGIKKHEFIERVEVYRVGPPIRYEGRLPPNITQNFGYIIRACIKGIKLLAKNDIDVIHSNTYSPAFIGQFCSMLFRKPHIITFHDLYMLGRSDFWNNWSRQPGISRFISIIAPLLERLSLMLPANIFHTVSETSKKDISHYVTKKPIVIIPNGINLEDYEYYAPLTMNSSQAIYIGRLVFYKNLQTILKCFDHVIKEVPSARLLIIGDGPFRTELERKARHLKGNVIFTNRVSHLDKVRLLKESSFLILPSLVEGFGIVILEAYACKKPVLVSNVMPLPEIVEDGSTGFTIRPFNINSWADSMIYLFKNNSKAQDFGLMGYEKLKQYYTIERIVDKLEEVYKLMI